MRARVRKDALASAGPPGPESPDDDRYWKGGLFYYNPADPRFMVPKRNGLGLDVNFGHPGGMAFGFVIVALIVGVCVTPFLL